MPDERVGVELKKKSRVSGKVVKTSLAGAVIDLGSGNLGVIPISQMGKEPVRNMGETVREGDEITAWVRRIDDRGRIELTLIEPLAVEWREIKKDMVLTGKVSKLEKFGAFIELGAGRPGLVHVSEMAHEYVKSPGEIVKVGDEVQVKVIEVDRRKKQIKLSMKALLSRPEKEKKVRKPREKVEQTVEQPEPPAPTAMEVALRKAMGQDEQAPDQKMDKPKRADKDRGDMEEILSRTLENRVRAK